MEVQLTPFGQLRLVKTDRDQKTKTSTVSLEKAFEEDWRSGLFKLAAGKVDIDNSTSLRYWRYFAERYLTNLCHVPEEAQRFEIEEPSLEDCARLTLDAPPMQGGEYLSGDTLLSIWNALDAWVHERVASLGGLSEFFPEYAPAWRRVGRVSFHLAENKADITRPFAFMATYSTGYTKDGKLKHLPLRKALAQYSGEKNRQALINLLSPVQRASENLDWVRELVDSEDIYRPMAWTADRAYAFLKSADTLEDCGLSVHLPDWWKKQVRPRVMVTIGEKKQVTLGTDSVLDFNVGIALGDKHLSSDDLERLLAGEDGLVYFKGQWIELDREKLSEALERWETIREEAGGGGISFIEGMRLLAGAGTDLKPKEEEEAEAEGERTWAEVHAGKAMRNLLSSLRDPGALDAVKTGKELRAELRPYQKDGLAWLHLLTGLGLGACLADDMGLGKTIQVLALLLCIHSGKSDESPPSLLVIPASLLGNWRQEAEKFTPSLKLQFIHPLETDKPTLAKIADEPAKHLKNADLVVTTYSMIGRQSWLSEMTWRLVILDEAQAIKNPSTRQTKAVKKLSAKARIVMTGTPVENRLGDLWSLFDFLNPGLLGSKRTFQAFIKTMQERERDSFAPLRRLVSPYILRRLKTDRRIIEDLPEKTETPSFCLLTKPQVALYVRTVNAMKKALQTADGMARRGLVLQSIMRLKQICNHPSQLKGDNDFNAADSGKFLRLSEICEELAQRQEKVLVFTQFSEIIDPLYDHLVRVFDREGLIMHGRTPVNKREKLIERFQHDDGPPFFILSLKVGGTGINLTAASHVIHFDRWWNPAVENQATDRAFRIGQKKNVLVHKFITRGTIEEKIDEMIREKRALAEGVLSDGEEMRLTEMSDEELMKIVRLDLNRASF